MENRDLLRDQIEQLGSVLAKIFSDFLGLKSKESVAEGVKISNDRLKRELTIDIEKIVALEYRALREYLVSLKLADTHAETLSEYFIEIGKTMTSGVDADLYFKKAIDLLTFANDISKTKSFERMMKKNDIENLLQKYK